ncbi:MAG: hypothetical protein D4R64_11325 [Porphyromonadaceae bacterium]|nr:MAG: hypothetical protein D4R64_11325 [Porphyromonadaceae bacterium]
MHRKIFSNFNVLPSALVLISTVMKTNPLILQSKIGILILILVIGTVACDRRKKTGHGSLIRFEKLVFTISPASLSDSIHLNHNNLVPFFRIFNEEVIRIGPDSLPGYAGQLERFIGDSLIWRVYTEVDKSAGLYQESCRKIDDALGRWATLTGNKRPDNLITFISGFNQSFITLPGCLGIGVDNYLGSQSPFYRGLDIPIYIRKNMNPDNLPADAVRAWLYSELPGPAPDGGFLDRMIYEGKVYYIASKLLPKLSDEKLFHYTEEQLNWCHVQEKAMWKYLAEQKILFSTERLSIRKFIEEAPFTRDFGNESPGRVGVWIGYRIVSSYVKATGMNLKDLIGITSAKEILSGSKYHP